MKPEKVEFLASLAESSTESARPICGVEHLCIADLPGVIELANDIMGML